MKSKILLRIAAIVILLHDVGHMFGHSGWRHSPDPRKQEIINQMLGSKFPFMGAERSMGQYFEGYGYAAALALLLIAVLLWILSASVDQSPPLVKKMLLPISVILLFWGILELIYFFPFAAAFTLLAMVLTVTASIMIKPISPRPVQA